jgi:hypothetical protein
LLYSLLGATLTASPTKGASMPPYVEVENEVAKLEGRAIVLEDAAIATAESTVAVAVHAVFYVQLGQLKLMAAKVLRQRALALAQKQSREYSARFEPADHSGARTITVNPATEES